MSGLTTQVFNPVTIGSKGQAPKDLDGNGYVNQHGLSRKVSHCHTFNLGLTIAIAFTASVKAIPRADVYSTFSTLSKPL